MRRTISFFYAAACCAALAVGSASAAIIVVEDFDSLDPTTDADAGSLGTGQLEDITGSTWSGVDSDSGDLQTLITAGPDRSLQIKTEENDLLQLTSSNTFASQTKTDAFSFFFDIESYNDGSNASSGRVSIGVRDSVAGLNIFSVILQSKAATAGLLDLTLQIVENDGGGGSFVNPTTTGGSASIGSIELNYDGVDTVSLSKWSGAGRTGTETALTTRVLTAGLIASNFAADSVYFRQVQSNDAVSRIIDINVDNLSVEVVPEPSTFVLLGALSLGLVGMRRRVR